MSPEQAALIGSRDALLLALRSSCIYPGNRLLLDFHEELVVRYVRQQLKIRFFGMFGT